MVVCEVEVDEAGCGEIDVDVGPEGQGRVAGVAAGAEVVGESDFAILGLAFAYSRAEWGSPRRGRDWRRYLPLTHVEQSVPSSSRRRASPRSRRWSLTGVRESSANNVVGVSARQRAAALIAYRCSAGPVHEELICRRYVSGALGTVEKSGPELV